MIDAIALAVEHPHDFIPDHQGNGQFRPRRLCGTNITGILSQENWRSNASPAAASPDHGEAVVDPELEKEKKARNLRKKLRQARELREKKDKGEDLLPEQLEKVIKIQELIRQLDALGFDAEGERKKDEKSDTV